MALKLTGRNPARFEFDDGVSQTVVIIQPNDEPDAVRAKLQRVLELEEPHARAALQATGLVSPDALRPAEPEFTAADRAAMDAQLAKTQPLGWGAQPVEELPEA
jgi:hypothetical protein